MFTNFNHRYFCRFFASALLLCFGLLLSWGCSKSSNAYYDVYYNPAWTADGNILATRERAVTSRSGGLWGGTAVAKDTEWVIIYLDDNFNVSSVSKIMDLGNEDYLDCNVSPSGNYIATVGKKGMIIYNKNYHAHSTISFSGAFRKFDWSPDESKLIVQTDDGVFLYLRDGTLVREIENLSSFHAWKYNRLIGGQFGDYPDISTRFINENDEIIVSDKNISGILQYFTDGNSYFGNYSKIQFPSFQTIESFPTLNNVLDDEMAVYGLSINPVHSHVLLFSNRGSYHGFGFKNIILINLDGSNKKALFED